MSAGEFFNLHGNDVDVSSNQCAWVRLRGRDTKSGKGRSIPLHDADLARWLKAAPAQGTLPTHESFYRSFKAACEALGLPTSVDDIRETSVWSYPSAGGAW